MTDRTAMPGRGASLLYWLIVAASLWILLRGHNEPGGGFVGGLVAVLATVVRATLQGQAAATRSLPLGDPFRLAMSGALLAMLSGVPPLLLGRPFLEHLSVTLPLGGSGFKLSTFLPFDIGIYLAVWGTLAGITLLLLDLDAGESSP